MKYGFIKVAAAIPSVKVADTQYNLAEIEKQVIIAEGEGVEIIVFPELSLTGYSCQDLFHQQILLDNIETSVIQLLDFTRQLDITVIVGAPICADSVLLNCALVIQHGKLIGIVPKTYLPNYGEFYEKRWFASSQDLQFQSIYYVGEKITISSDIQLFTTSQGVKFGIEICEDLWAPIPPSNQLTLAGAELIFNLSASDDLIGKHNYLKSLVAQQSARTISGYIYSGCGFGESTQDVVYGGNGFIYENGQLLAEAKRFEIESQLIISEIDIEKLRTERRSNTTFVNAQRPSVMQRLRANNQLPLQNITACIPASIQRDFVLTRLVDKYPFIPKGDKLREHCEEILNIQVCGLAKRLSHINCKTVVIGVSGGLDSTLALLVATQTFDKLGYDRRGIIGITMPGFGTTDRTYNNAITLMQNLGITIREISIAASVKQHFTDIEHNIDVHDITYENSQARERTQILMDISNQVGGIVIGTGDLSELALGWCTYNGDHMSMYAVNVGIPKTLIKHLVSYVAENGVEDSIKLTLEDIVNTPISPELTPADENGEIVQKTEDLVGPYELHDFFLYYVLRFGFRPKKIFWLAQQAFKEEYADGVILHWLRIFYKRFFSQQFKRSCLPDGPKVGSVSLSPRGDWRMPSDAMLTDWIKDLEDIQC
ncbi:MAG: NAD(+) synthase [Prevotella bivia]|uniref:NAD(+) synthase n=1 Tax=Prevotella bivia TaxID=28125 RepID=UPI00051031AA|nr:NAD(+) synthase [Prevotella bivia]KGF21820.1 NAD synthetase [Prevotella bivia DNF00188]MDU7314495.1 NAD(+) synthase [Prevotella bivia]MDZ3817940.1 NAD(+) synthase [Prevotella bivia]